MSKSINLQLLLFFGFVSLLNLPLNSAMTFSSTTLNNTAWWIEYDSFGFTDKGVISVNVSSVYVTPANNTIYNASLYGFYLEPHPYGYSEFPDYIINGTFICTLDHPMVKVLFTFSNLSNPPQSSFVKTFSIGEPNRYKLMYANCQNGSVSMHVRSEAYNIEKDGTKNYLSVGETQLPLIYLIFSLAYVPLMILWAYACFVNKTFVYKIHICIGLLPVLTAICLALAAEDWYHTQFIGKGRGWGTLFRFAHILKGIFAYIVMLLIATGISFVKSFLRKEEIALLVLGGILQIAMNAVEIQVLLFGESVVTSANSILIQIVLDFVCWGIFMILIEWSVEWLKENSEVNKNAVHNLRKMRHIMNFYYASLLYIFYVKYLTPMIRSYSYYRCLWMVEVGVEIVTLGYYCSMCYLFRPVQTTQYFALAENEEDEDRALETIQTSEEFRL